MTIQVGSKVRLIEEPIAGAGKDVRIIGKGNELAWQIQFPDGRTMEIADYEISHRYGDWLRQFDA